MTRIMMLNPPIRTNEPPRFPPYGLAQLAAVADEAGMDVGIIDANAERVDREIILKELREAVEYDKKPIDAIGVGGLVTTYQWVKEILPWLRKEYPTALLMAGGGLATSLGAQLLRWIPDLDLLCIGEGEKTLLEVAEHLWDRDFTKVKGIIYRDGDAITETERRPLMGEAELNRLPYPSWNLLPMETYFQNSRLPLSAESLMCRRRATLIGQRGCPYNCTFCSHGGLGGDSLEDGSRLRPVVRWQSAKYLVNHMRWLRIRYAIDFVSFLDEDFLANKKRTLEVCDLMEQEDLTGVVNWGCLGDARTADPIVLHRGRACGLSYVSYGFESNNQRDLDEVGKGVKVEQNERAFLATMDAKVNPITTYIIGYKGQTLQGAYDSVAFWAKNGILCTPFFLTPYPGSKLFRDNMSMILKQFGAYEEEDQDANAGKVLKGAADAYEKYVVALGDATDLVINLTRYSDVDLLGLRDLMSAHDLDRIVAMAKEKGEKLVLQDVKPQKIIVSGEGSMGERGV